MSKTGRGLYFEDFSVGQLLEHATPRTVTAGDCALYQSLYGGRFASTSSEPFARSIGYRSAPVDDLLVFHIVFGKTVPDISLNAVANLGYAEGRFLEPVFAGDTLCAHSTVIGLKETSSGQTGIVYVRSRGVNQRGDTVLDYVRWVLVAKRLSSAPAPQTVVPDLESHVRPGDLGGSVPRFAPEDYDVAAAGSPFRASDYGVGERIDHVDGQTIEEAEHQIATRLYQNTARVHFDAMLQKDSRFGRRLVYGGHVISLVRALTFNGLGNAFHVAALNGGRHVAPVFAGDTVYAWSEVLDRADIPGRTDIASLRLRTVGVKNRTCGDFPLHHDEAYAEGVVLDLDYWVCLPA